MPWPVEPSPRASPESLSRTRWYGVAMQESLCPRVYAGRLPEGKRYLPIWTRVKPSIFVPLPSTSSSTFCTVFESSLIHFCSGRTRSA